MTRGKNKESWVRTEEELASVRARLTADAVLDAVAAASGRLLIAGDVGLGKTELMRKLIQQHRHDADQARYDLLVYMAPQHRILDEQQCVVEHRALPLEAQRPHDVAVLVGRPRARCGRLDGEWGRYERAGCSQLGRQKLCGNCPERDTCTWPRQFTGEALEGKRVVMTLQSYVNGMPNFIPRLLDLTGARSALVLMDESAVLDANYKRVIDYGALELSRSVFAWLLRQGCYDDLQPWIELHDQLVNPMAQVTLLPSPPRLNREVAQDIQERGLEKHGRAFRYLGYDLDQLQRSNRRFRSPDGNGIEYICRPLLDGVDYVIAAAGVPLDLARHRLGDNRLQPFMPGLRLRHQGTRIYNINSGLGAKRNYPKNERQIVHAAAQFIAKLATEGKRTIVVTKKDFANSGADLLTTALRELTGRPYRVVQNATAADVVDPLLVPLITYGASGVNTYEAFDAAIALCSYNANGNVIEARLNDVHDLNELVPVERLVVGGESVWGCPGSC